MKILIRCVRRCLRFCISTKLSGDAELCCWSTDHSLGSKGSAGPGLYLFFLADFASPSPCFLSSIHTGVFLVPSTFHARSHQERPLLMLFPLSQNSLYSSFHLVSFYSFFRPQVNITFFRSFFFDLPIWLYSFANIMYLSLMALFTNAVLYLYNQYDWWNNRSINQFISFPIGLKLKEYKNNVFTFLSPNYFPSI